MSFFSEIAHHAFGHTVTHFAHETFEKLSHPKNHSAPSYPKAKSPNVYPEDIPSLNSFIVTPDGIVMTRFDYLYRFSGTKDEFCA